jgi:ABC-type antimicrobial peptide transport system permease subunit
LPELGVRIALGASGRHIVWIVVRSSAAVMALGIAIGLSAALSLKDILDGILFGVPTTEPRIYAIAVAALLVAGSLAMIGPVARALRIDPVNVLRHE